MSGLGFPPSRHAALGRLEAFIPRAGRFYAAGRNVDPGPDQTGAVSRLSPYLRHRILTEEEVISQVLARHDLTAAEKFVQEVLWRTYWKGWLEMRPEVWRRFLEERDRQRDLLGNSPALHAAERGQTGIEGFDDWARELIETGYLHNHARMWFASIWIFTLRLPWVLGADFFLRHLIDADPASNTLSWRWVAGLQTVGKTYLATKENIARCTNGRFAPDGLATAALPLVEAPLAPPHRLPRPEQVDTAAPCILLLTSDDFHPESLFRQDTPFASVIIAAERDLSWGDTARNFAAEAAQDTASRAAEHFRCASTVTDRLDADALLAAAALTKVQQIVTPYAPVGPAADALKRLTPLLAREGIRMVQVRRSWDGAFWPHAGKGFFSLKERIPAILRDHGFA